MIDFDEDLSRRLALLRERGLHRELLRVDSPPGPRLAAGGKPFLNFASNDYLGFANHPLLKEAAARAVEKFGAGAGASRLIVGSLAPFHELEESLAAFKNTEAALVFSTGYAAAVGTITALMGRNDILLLDRRVHACIVDAARLSGAKLRIFDHNDLADLEDKLGWANRWSIRAGGNPKAAVLIVTESVFSMDGDAAPLREIVALKERYGAWLMVDEAHATGIIGREGRGLADELGVGARIEIQMGTLGKALGASGGYICGRRALIEYLVNCARSFIFSTAPVPASAAAAIAGIRLARAAEGGERRKILRQRIAEVDSGLGRPPAAVAAAIIPLILGGESKAVAAAMRLRDRNVFVPAIRYPTVARGAARLRVTLTAAHSREDVAELLAALNTLDD